MTFEQDPIANLRGRAENQGEAARFELKGVTCTLLAHPRLVHKAFTHPDLHKRQGRPPATCLLGRGLMTSEGELNKQQRKLLRPLFGAAERPGWQAIVREQLEELTAGWKHGQPLNSLREFGRLSLAIACRVLLGRRLPEEELIQQVLEEVLQDPSASVRPRLDELADGWLRRGRGPMVELLLAQPLDDSLRRDELITMLLGAHETSATTMAWSMRLLALYGGRGTSHQVVAESLRLYPPGWLVSRRVDQQVDLDGVVLPAGSAVLMSPMVTHYLPEIWEDPHLFRPERFREGPVSGSFFPFGGGRRSCIGESLAWVEAEEAVETLRDRWRLEPVAPGPVQLLPLASLRPACGLPARLCAL